jgi:hypothetical protein
VVGFCKDGIENWNAGKARKFLISWTISDTGLFGYCLCYNLRNVFPNYGKFLLKHVLCVCVFMPVCTTHQIARRHIPEDIRLHGEDHEKSKSGRDMSFFSGCLRNCAA